MKISRITLGLVMFTLPVILHAQLAVQSIGVAQSSPPDSIVQITAEAEGLSQVDPSTLPLFASCWWTVFPGGRPVPMPCPPNGLSVPIYKIVDGIYLVDETGSAVSENLPRTSSIQPTKSVSAASIMER